METLGVHLHSFPTEGRSMKRMSFIVFRILLMLMTWVASHLGGELTCHGVLH